jgi:hypothetical protein
MTDRKIKFAVVGAGHIGKRHAEMVRRDAEGELEYYRLDGAYNKEHYFIKDGNHSKIRKWDELQEELLAQGVELYHFKSKTEVFNAVYQRGKRLKGYKESYT